MKSYSFVNGTGGTIPAGAVMVVTGEDANGNLSVAQVTTNNSLYVVFNGPADVPNGAFGVCFGCSQDTIAAINPADLPYTYADTFGTVSGDWNIRKGSKGFRVPTQPYQGLANAMPDPGGTAGDWSPTVDGTLSTAKQIGGGQKYTVDGTDGNRGMFWAVTQAQSSDSTVTTNCWANQAYAWSGRGSVYSASAAYSNFVSQGYFPNASGASYQTSSLYDIIFPVLASQFPNSTHKIPDQVVGGIRFYGSGYVYSAATFLTGYKTGSVVPDPIFAIGDPAGAPYTGNAAFGVFRQNGWFNPTLEIGIDRNFAVGESPKVVGGIVVGYSSSPPPSSVSPPASPPGSPPVSPPPPPPASPPASPPTSPVISPPPTVPPPVSPPTAPPVPPTILIPPPTSPPVSPPNIVSPPPTTPNRGSVNLPLVMDTATFSTVNANRVVLTSPNGTLYAMTVSNAGVAVLTAIPVSA